MLTSASLLARAPARIIGNRARLRKGRPAAEVLKARARQGYNVAREGRRYQMLSRFLKLR
jgi:hypothetical protein